MGKPLFILCAAALMASCGLDPKPTDPELDNARLQIREKYEPILTGEWYKDTAMSDKFVFRESLRLNADHSFTRVIDLVTRKLVTINGVETYTDWEHLADTTEGKWDINVFRDDETKEFKKQLRVYPDNSDYTLSIPYLYFTEANDTAIFINNYYVGYMKRQQGGKP